MGKAHLTKNGFYVETVEADEIGGEGTFTPLPEFDPSKEVPRFVGIGWQVVPLSVRDDFVPAPPIVSNEAIDAEHDRRVLAGRAFAVDGIGDVPLEGSEKTQLVLLALKDTARDLKDASITAPVLVFTDRDGTDRRMTAGQMIALVNAGKAWVQSVHEAKRALKAMDPIPADFADDRHWPS